MHSLPAWQASLQLDSFIGSLVYRVLEIAKAREKNLLNQEKESIPILKLIRNQFEPVIQGRPMNKENLHINQEKYANIDLL